MTDWYKKKGPSSFGEVTTGSVKSILPEQDPDYQAECILVHLRFWNIAHITTEHAVYADWVAVFYLNDEGTITYGVDEDLRFRHDISALLNEVIDARYAA